MRRAFRLLLILLSLVVGIAAAYWFLSYNPKEFHGAGDMRDTGFWSYPRYHAPLGDVPLAEEGSYAYRFSGVPSEKMVLQLYAPGYSEKNRGELESLSTQISVQVVGPASKLVCVGSGSPSGRRSEDRWVLMSSRLEAAFWHDGCNGREFARGLDYTLQVTIKSPDPKSPRVLLKAILEGGGNELP